MYSLQSVGRGFYYYYVRRRHLVNVEPLILKYVYTHSVRQTRCYTPCSYLVIVTRFDRRTVNAVPNTTVIIASIKRIFICLRSQTISNRSRFSNIIFDQKYNGFFQKS